MRRSLISLVVLAALTQVRIRTNLGKSSLVSTILDFYRVCLNCSLQVAQAGRGALVLKTGRDASTVSRLRHFFVMLLSQTRILSWKLFTAFSQEEDDDLYDDEEEEEKGHDISASAFSKDSIMQQGFRLFFFKFNIDIIAFPSLPTVVSKKILMALRKGKRVDKCGLVQKGFHYAAGVCPFTSCSLFLVNWEIMYLEAETN